MKIIVEVDGQRMEVVSEDAVISTPADMKEVPCTCVRDCGYVHREFAGTWLLELSARLTTRPLWVAV